MRSTAPKVDPEAQRDSEAVVLPVTRAAGSAFAPSAVLLTDFTAGRAGWRQFERRYTAACLEVDVARWRSRMWSAGSGRRP